MSNAIKKARDLIDGMRAPGHHLWSTWQIEALTAALDDQAAEIARLTAELARLREVPGDVEAVIAATSHAIDRDEADDKLRTAIARAIAAARSAPPATVGGLLATAPVDLDAPAGSRWTHAIEWLDCGTWFRIAPGESTDGCPTLVLSTWWDGRWRYEDENPVSIDACVCPLPARLVPAHLADLDPATRGPLPGGEG